MTWTHKVAVVTGAAGGIGRGLAAEALSRGMRVVLADNNAAKLAAAVADLDGDIVVAPTDVGDAGAVERLAATAYDAFGQVDLLFNNAGVLSGGLSWEIPPARWARLLEINVMGVVHGIASFVPRMIAANRPARIVNTASIGGFLPSPLIAPYVASKFAVVAMTEALAVELMLEGTQIEVSLLAPGAVKTEIYAETRTVSGSGTVAAALGRMREFTEGTGIGPDDYARRAFAGIDAGRFWLISQPELWSAAILERTERALAGQNPRPGDYGIEG